MKSEKLLRLVFVEAVEIEEVETRAAYLDDVCAGDQTLRQRVESLLAIDSQGGQPETADPLSQHGEPGPGSLIDRYKLLERIGEGGCGVVYLAEQEKPVRRRVALKIIKLGMDTKQVIARFEAERQALAMMDHPSIAKVLDAGATDRGRPYFVMELVRGTRITDYCDGVQMRPGERLELFVRVCQAVQHAHQKGIIHRDLKPSNVLVTEVDGEPTPKIIDFGIAKAIEGRLTEQTLLTENEQLIGTPAYMSPEQTSYSTSDIDTRSDIYSLGVLLYELLTGQTPFDTGELIGGGIDQVRRTLRETDPPRPSTRLSKLDQNKLSAIAGSRECEPPRLIHQVKGDLDWIVMRCLEKNPNRRYETANSLALDVRRHLDHEAIAARPPARLYLLHKSIQRHKLAYAAVLMVVAALATGLALAAWQFAEKSDALARAVSAEVEQSRLRGEAEAQAVLLGQRNYASDMNAAMRALDQWDFGRLRSLLDRHRPIEGQDRDDRRGWEWRYLWQQARSDATADLLQRDSQLISLSTSADGRWLATGTAHRGGVELLDLQNPDHPTVLLSEESERVLTAFSPAAPILAYTAVDVDAEGGRKASLYLWDIERRRLHASHALDADCVGLVFGEHGERLVTSTSSGNSGTITIWRMPDAVRESSFPSKQFGGELTGTGFVVTPDLRMAAYALEKRSIRLLDLANGGQVVWEPEVVPQFITALAFSPDGKTLAVGGGSPESEIGLWDIDIKQKIRRLEGHDGFVPSVEFTPDGRRLISCSGDRTLAVWDVGTGERLGTWYGHELEVWCVHLMPDGKTVISGSKDGTVSSWDTSEPRRRSDRIEFPTGVKSWCFAAGGDSLLTADSEGVVTRWSGERFQDREVLFKASPGVRPPGFGALAEDGSKIALRSTDGVCSVIDLSGKERNELFRASVAGRIPFGFMVSPDLLYTSGEEEQGTLWSVSRGELLHSGPLIPNQGRTCYSPAQDWLLQLSFNNRLRTVSLGDGQIKNHHLEFLEAGGGAFSRDGQLFAIASHRGQVHVWSTDTWEEVVTLGGVLMGRDGVTFSPDGDRILSTGGSRPDEAFRLFDTESWLDVLTLHCEGTHFILPRFSPDGSSVGMMDTTGRLTVWQAPNWEQIAAEERRTGGWLGRPRPSQRSTGTAR